MNTPVLVFLFAAGLSLTPRLCGQPTPPPVVETPDAERALNTVAEAYVKLVRAVGQHDADYVDAYYGPPEWKQQAEQTRHGYLNLKQSREPRP